MLPRDIASELTIIYCSDAAAHWAVQQRVAGMSLGDTFMDGVAGNLLVVGAKQEQVCVLKMLCFQCLDSGRHADACRGIRAAATHSLLPALFSIPAVKPAMLHTSWLMSVSADRGAGHAAVAVARECSDPSQP